MLFVTRRLSEPESLLSLAFSFSGFVVNETFSLLIVLLLVIHEILASNLEPSSGLPLSVRKRTIDLAAEGKERAENLIFSSVTEMESGCRRSCVHRKSALESHKFPPLLETVFLNQFSPFQSFLNGKFHFGMISNIEWQ